MSNLNIRNLWVATLLSSFCSIPVIASAAVNAPAEDERTANVFIADLDLVNEQGVEEVYRQLRRASRRVCGSPNIISAGSLKQRQLNQHCYAETLTNAVDELSDVRLSQVHADSTRLR